MTFLEKVALIRADVTNPANSIDNNSIYNELLLERSNNSVTLLTNINNNLLTIINIFKGVEPSLLSAGETNIDMNSGVQVGTEMVPYNFNVYIQGSSVLGVNIKGLDGIIADVNAANQLKTT
jgi:hypothetical protein